jgi:general secretion pathway protein G
MRFSEREEYRSVRVSEYRGDKHRTQLPLRHTHTPTPRHTGFSLVEIMIVVVIIGLMAGLVTYATSGYLDRAKRQRARSDIATYSGAVDAYYLAKGSYPDNQTGLNALVPEFIKVLQPDPWGRPYQYVAPGKGGPYDIISYGADGRDGGTGSDADITNWDVEVAEIKHK